MTGIHLRIEFCVKALAWLPWAADTYVPFRDEIHRDSARRLGGPEPRLRRHGHRHEHGQTSAAALVKRNFPQRVDTVSTLCLTLLQVGTTWRKTRPAERESTSRPLHRRAMPRPFAHGMLAILDKRKAGRCTKRR